jgi:hypothetical protein
VNVSQQLPPWVFYALVALLVVGRFLVRELRERKLVLGRIYLLPAIVGIMAAALLVTTIYLFPATALLVVGEACITIGIGFGIGLAVAHFTKVRLGDVPGTVYVLGSPITVGIWLAALALRWAARVAVPFGDHAATLSANAALFVMVAAALAMVRYRVSYEARILRERGITTSVPAI